MAGSYFQGPSLGMFGYYSSSFAISVMKMTGFTLATAAYDYSVSMNLSELSSCQKAHILREHRPAA